MYCGMPEGTSQAEAMSNSEKIMPVSLAVIELCLSEGISQLFSQLLSQSENFVNNVLLKFRSNFLKAFQVNLKACLGFTKPILPHCHLRLVFG